MPIELLYILGSLGYLVLAWKNFRAALLSLIFLVPIYILRLELVIPTNLYEMLLAVTLLVQLIRAPKQLLNIYRATIRPIIIPLLLILVGLLIGLFVAPDFRIAAGIIKGWFIVPWILYSLLAFHFKKQDLIQGTITLLLSGVPLALVAIVQALTGNYITEDSRASGWYESANYLTLYLVPINLLGVSLWSRISQKFNWILIGTWTVSVLAVFLSFSFGGWLALVLSVAAGLIWYRFDLFKKWIIPLLSVGALGAVALYFTNERFATMLNLAERSSASIRLQVWAASLLMIKEHFLTGLGPGSFKFNYQGYVLRLFNPPIEYAILHPHNLLFQILISAGVLGLVGFIWIFVLYFKKLTAKHIMNAGLFMAMAAVLIHGLVDTPYFKNDLALLFWILFAFNTIQNSGQEKTQNRN